MKRISVMLAVVVMSLIAAGCASATPAPTPLPPTPTPQPPTPTVPPPTPVPAEKPAFTLGAEERNEAGGYAYHPIAEYKIERSGTIVTLVAPGGDVKYGPLISLNASVVSGTKTAEEAFAKIKSQMSEASHASEPRQATVDGSPALVVDVKSTVESTPVSARLVIVRPSATRGLVITAAAPTDKWSDVEKPFEAVVASIKLFEPTPTVAAKLPTTAPEIITTAMMAKDVEPGTNAPIGIAGTFGPEQSTYHAFVLIKGAPKNTQVKARWVAVNVSGVAPNSILTEAESNVEGSQYIHFDYTPQAGSLLPGTYHVDILVNERFNRSILFVVLKTSPTPKATFTPAAAANPCKLEPGQSGIFMTNTHDFKILLTIGGGEWGTHDYWFEPKSATPIQFPPGNYTATLNVPGQGNYKFSNDKVNFEAGKCYRYTSP